MHFSMILKVLSQFNYNKKFSYFSLAFVYAYVSASLISSHGETFVIENSSTSLIYFQMHKQLSLSTTSELHDTPPPLPPPFPLQRQILLLLKMVYCFCMASYRSTPSKLSIFIIRYSFFLCVLQLSLITRHIHIKTPKRLKQRSNTHFSLSSALFIGNSCHDFFLIPFCQIVRRVCTNSLSISIEI